MSTRSQIEEILDLAASIDQSWARVIEETGDHPPVKAWEIDDDARRDLAATATALLKDLLTRADDGELITLGHDPREVIFMVWGEGPEEAEPQEITLHCSPCGEQYDEVTVLEEGTIYTVCPWCFAVNGGLVEVDRAERWNRAEIDCQPTTMKAARGRGGVSRRSFDTVPNPLAGLPLLWIRVDRNADFQPESHHCGRCHQEVLIPEWVESHFE